MVDLKASNIKLVDRSIRIIDMIAKCGRQRAQELLEASGGHVKVAIVMEKRGVDLAGAQRLLEQSGGRLRGAIGG